MMFKKSVLLVCAASYVSAISQVSVIPCNLGGLDPVPVSAVTNKRYIARIQLGSSKQRWFL